MVKGEQEHFPGLPFLTAFRLRISSVRHQLGTSELSSKADKHDFSDVVPSSGLCSSITAHIPTYAICPSMNFHIVFLKI